ncbi:hypothetical protein F4861DRAFT_498961 [Xylaria intraflava]|nr:hypothetical protein F4861DRAFT_498961 [Xylaria intraflava]
MPKLKSADLSTIIAAPAKLDTDGHLRVGHPWDVWYFSPLASLREDGNDINPALFEDIYQRRLF